MQDLVMAISWESQLSERYSLLGANPDSQALADTSLTRQTAPYRTRARLIRLVVIVLFEQDEQWRTAR